MYAEYFHMKEMPFAIEPNPHYLLLDDDHREALATLVYAIDQQEGWALLLGEAGIGKTTLIMALLRELKDRVVPAVITNPRLSALDFFNMVGMELGLEGPFESKGRFLVAMNQIIKRCHRQGKVLLLIIDEAQSLAPSLLEELRLLSNMDNFSPRVLNIFLVGQPHLLLLLKKAGARSLMQRLRRYYVLKPLGPEETASYVRHRLEVAGGHPNIFDDEALAEVYRLTGGNPRLINTLCDDSLLLAYTLEQNTVTREIVRDAGRDNPSLRWPPDLEVPRSQPLAAPEEDAPAPEPRPDETVPSQVPPQPEPPVQAQAQTPPEPEPSADEPPAQTPSEPEPPTQAPPAAEEPPAQAVPEPQTRAQDQLKPPPLSFDQAPAAEAPGVAGLSDEEILNLEMPPLEEMRRPGLFSRLAASLSRDAPGSLWKRALVLLVVAGLVFGIYQVMARGGWPYLRYKVSSLWGSQPATILMPEGPSQGQQRMERRAPDGTKDWGPILPAPARPKSSQDNRPAQGGGNG